MRILGIDPGLGITGYGCVELVDGDPEPRLVEAGVFRLKPGTPMPFRLKQLYGELTALIDELRPDRMVVEQLFSHYRHARTAILMGHTRGVILLAGETRDVELDELAATEVKRAVAGNGHATKQQVQMAVMTQCGLSEMPEPSDLADAIAIALCAARRVNAVAV